MNLSAIEAWSENPDKLTVITGHKATGKTTLAKALSEFDDSKVVVNMRGRMISSKFNDYLEGADIVVVELEGFGDTSKGRGGVQRHTSERALLKSFIETILSDEIVIEQSTCEPRTVPNNIAWIIVCESFDIKCEYRHVAL